MTPACGAQVAGLLLLLDMRFKESASLITCVNVHGYGIHCYASLNLRTSGLMESCCCCFRCLRELASKQPAAARVLASVLESLFQQDLNSETTPSTTEVSESQDLLSTNDLAMHL